MKIPTLSHILSKGAKRYVTLKGSAAQVQKDVYSLYNKGFCAEIPDFYREGIDETATVEISDYRIRKVTKALALAKVAQKGRREGGKMKQTLNKYAKQIYTNLLNSLPISEERERLVQAPVYSSAF